MKLECPKSHCETRFDFPVFSNYRVVIVLTDDLQASAEYLGDRDNFLVARDLSNSRACHIHPEGRGFSYLVFQKAAGAGTIAHECWHAVYQLFDFAGVTLGDEVVAYHLGFAVQKVVAYQYKILNELQEGKNAHSGRGSAKAGAGRNRRSRRDGSKSKTPRIFRVYDSAKVRRSATRVGQKHKQPGMDSRNQH